MSVVGRKLHQECLNSEDPFKKRCKVEVTAADLCKVVIEDFSSDENSEKGDGQTTSDQLGETSCDEDQGRTDSSEDSDDEPFEGNTNTIWYEKNPKDEGKIDYKEPVGLKELPLGPQPRDFFNLLMNKSIYNLIIKNTNAYISHVPKNRYNAKTFFCKPLKEDSIQKFLGLLFLMGVIQLPDIDLYWSDDILFNFPSFRQIMSMEMFLSIFHSLHFCDDSISDSVDPLKKTRPLTEFFNVLMESIYIPQKDLVMNNPISISECSKKGSVKVFTLCDSEGMVLKYLVQRRTKGEKAKNLQGRCNIAKELLEGQMGKGHSVYMGEYFASIPLIGYLKAENTYATGDLSQKYRRHCEKLWSSFSDENYFLRYTGEGLCLLKWKENRKEFSFISSEFDGSLKKTNDQRRAKTKPLGLVELKTRLQEGSNWLQESFPVGNKKLNWYKSVAIQIINIIMMNSYHLYSRCPLTKRMSLLKFKLNLIKTLLYSNIDSEDNMPSQSPERLAKPHVLDYIGKNGKGFRKRKRCKYCITERGVRVDSYYHCITCDNQPGFCLGQCFIKYHKYDLSG